LTPNNIQKHNILDNAYVRYLTDFWKFWFFSCRFR